MRAHLPDVESFATAAIADGLTDVYLLGMGGSSLCAEVLRDVGPAGRRRVRLVVLDTTDERAVGQVTSALVPERSLFLVASKSGSTIEVSSLDRHFWSVMTGRLAAGAGRHFVAITDPDTPLVARAGQAGFRRTFLNPPDIGGRFSALSLFGLVPAALLGVDVSALLESGRQMADRCRRDEAGNPGLALGAFMGAEASGGRDKLTLLLPPDLLPLGAWIEQLVAESTGKEGRGVLPVVGEPVGAVPEYGRDRAFVAVTTPASTETSTFADALEAAGHPVFRIATSSAELGGEFYRWEVATSVAGLALGVNPFDEPNVRSAKQRTQGQLDARQTTGAFSLDPPLERHGGALRREHRKASATSASGPGRYVALLDYLPADGSRTSAVDRLRRAIRTRTGYAMTYGVGPRYLHSTGQYHKGGPDTGIFLLLTAADQTTTPVPDEAFSFSTLKAAQALGDFDALVAAGRDVVHCHVDDAAGDLAAALERAVNGLV
jgi:hypothetical protein